MRAAAFERRKVATLAVGGLYSFFLPIRKTLPLGVQVAHDVGDAALVNELVSDRLTKGELGTGTRRFFENGQWCFNASIPADLFKQMKLMTLEDITDRIKCPVLVCEAADDMFFKYQPALVSNTLEDLATHIVLTAKDSAG
jgi:hypothetical protein